MESAVPVNTGDDVIRDELASASSERRPRRGQSPTKRLSATYRPAESSLRVFDAATAHDEASAGADADCESQAGGVWVATWCETCRLINPQRGPAESRPAMFGGFSHEAC